MVEYSSAKKGKLMPISAHLTKSKKECKSIDPFIATVQIILSADKIPVNPD
jgi:hypothetical protein